MPGRLRWIRSSAILLGILWLFWLPMEDSSLLAVYFFAAGNSALAIYRLQRTKMWSTWKPGLRIVGLGCLAGFLVVSIALLLMAFKSGLHGHGVPDFTPAQILAVGRSFPIWVAGGGILGLGWHFWGSSSITTKP